MIISLSTHPFVFRSLDDDILSLYPKHGFKNAEVWAMPPHFPYADNDAADRIAENMARFGIKIVSLHGPIYPDVRTYKQDKWYSLGSTEDAHRVVSVEANRKAAAWLARNGGGTMVIHTGFPSGNWYPHRWYSLLSSISELVEHTPDNVRFAVENTPVDSGCSDIIHDIAIRFPKDRVGVCIDVGHANIIETVQSAIRNAGNRLIHVHASDNHGNKDEHLTPGDGNIHWKTVMEELRKVDFQGFFTLELRTCAHSDNQTLEELDQLIADAAAAMSQITEE